MATIPDTAHTPNPKETPLMQASQITFDFDLPHRFEVDASSPRYPRRSDRWAATDRGWVYDRAHAPSFAGNLPVGNYLRYTTTSDPEDRARCVHAVATPWEPDKDGAAEYGPRQARWFATETEAARWICEVVS